MDKKACEGCANQLRYQTQRQQLCAPLKTARAYLNVRKFPDIETTPTSRGVVVWTAARQAREVVDLYDCAARLSYVFIRMLSAPRKGHGATIAVLVARGRHAAPSTRRVIHTVSWPVVGNGR